MLATTLTTMARAAQTPIWERELERLGLLVEVLEEIPNALDTLSASNKRQPKLLGTTVNLHGHIPKCDMYHWHLRGLSFTDRTPAWRQFFRNEDQLTEISLWLREDGEIVCRQVPKDKKRETPTRAFSLTNMRASSLRQLLHDLRNPLAVF